MKITNVKIKKVDSSVVSLKAICSVTFDDVFVIHDIKVVKSYKTGKLFIAMPSKKVSNGEFRDVCHPINNELREEITEVILEKYNEEIKEN